MSDILVKVDNVSKRFCRSLKRSLWYGLQDLGSEIGGRRHGGGSGLPQSSADVQLRTDEFWAVKDVSFELRRGECLGLIGQNGAGKTTLLKILNGLIKPDAGIISMSGRVGALIALGAGFNPILSGRENIFINASVLGLSKREIHDKIDEIVDFAGIDDFIDSPVQNYSSGMIVRLGFAVATALAPDILILDEVLAVGDASFRAKCYRKISELQQEAAIIFVSHSMDQVGNICSSICGMEKGHSRLFSNKESGIRWYQEQGASSEINKGVESLADSIESFECSDFAHTVLFGEFLALNIVIKSLADVSSVSSRVVFYSSEGVIVAEWNSSNGKSMIDSLYTGQNTFRFSLGPLYLKRGDYSLGILLQNEKTRENLIWSHQQLRLFVDGPLFGNSCYVLP